MFLLWTAFKNILSLELWIRADKVSGKPLTNFKLVTFATIAATKTKISILKLEHAKRTKGMVRLYVMQKASCKLGVHSKCNTTTITRSDPTSKI